MGKRLRLPDDPMYHMLREGQLTDFNAKKAAGEKVDLTAEEIALSLVHGTRLRYRT